MDTSHYNQDINHKLELLEAYKNDVFEATIRIASEVITVANRRNDRGLRALCNYYIAHYYYNVRNCSECIRYLEKTIDDATAAELYLELCRAMTLLANAFVRQGNMANAMQALATSISRAEQNVAEHHEFARVLLLSYAEFSSICNYIGDYSKALEYELSAERHFYLVEREDYYPLYFTRHLANYVKSYIMLGDSTNAGDVVSQMDNFSLHNESSILEPYHSICHILWNDHTGNHKWDDIYFDRLNNFFRSRTFNGAYPWEFFYLLQQMSCNDAYEDYYRFLSSKMESFLDFTDLHGYRVWLSNIKMDYFERKNMKPRRLEELEHFREYINASVQSQNRAMSLVIGIRTMNALDIELAKALEVRTNEDDLTGLPNRKAFNDMADRFFERCIGKERNLGLAMLTIDGVKKINDMYGYTIGDRCLVELANILKRYPSDHIFVARYVGAEFVLLFEGFRDEEILERLRSINDEIIEAISKQDLPPFTLSQGVCAHIPQGLNKIWDYTSCADLALIRAMQLGTGQAILVHHANELAAARPLALSQDGKLFPVAQ